MITQLKTSNEQLRNGQIFVTHFTLRCSYRLGEAKERQSQVDEAVLIQLQFPVALDQLETNTSTSVTDSTKTAASLGDVKRRTNQTSFGVRTNTV